MCGPLAWRPHLWYHGKLSALQNAPNSRVRSGETSIATWLCESLRQRGRGLRGSNSHECWILRGRWTHGTRGLLCERWQSAAVLRGQAKLSALQPRLGRLLHGREYRQRWSRVFSRTLLEKVSFRSQNRPKSGRIRRYGTAHADRNQGVLLLHRKASSVLS